MSSLHLATDDQLMFVGELLAVIGRIQETPGDDPATTRDWLAQTVDALADLAACHEELGAFSLKLRELARAEGGPGQEDTDGDGLEGQGGASEAGGDDLGGEVVDEPLEEAPLHVCAGAEVQTVRAA